VKVAITGFLELRRRMLNILLRMQYLSQTPQRRTPLVLRWSRNRLPAHSVEHEHAVLASAHAFCLVGALEGVARLCTCTRDQLWTSEFASWHGPSFPVIIESKRGVAQFLSSYVGARFGTFFACPPGDVLHANQGQSLSYHYARTCPA